MTTKLKWDGFIKQLVVIHLGLMGLSVLVPEVESQLLSNSTFTGNKCFVVCIVFYVCNPAGGAVVVMQP